MKFDDLSKIMLKIRKDLKIDDYICACRRDSYLYKPNPGMIVDLINYYSLDKNKSYMIGDTWKDVAAGNAAGVKTIYIGGPIEREDVVPNYYATDILHACELIKELDNEVVR
jgi:D-glycero-D-manno-heptose 1,7-bisphosphate phosphatase